MLWTGNKVLLIFFRENFQKLAAISSYIFSVNSWRGYSRMSYKDSSGILKTTCTENCTWLTQQGYPQKISPPIYPKNWSKKPTRDILGGFSRKSCKNFVQKLLWTFQSTFPDYYYPRVWLRISTKLIYHTEKFLSVRLS